MSKVRKVDLNADEFIVGITGMTPEQLSVYVVSIFLQYSTGGEIPKDDERLFRIIKARKSVVKKAVSDLLAAGKLTENGDKMCKNRVLNELKRARNRMEKAQENGEKGGRPSIEIEENQSDGKPGGLFSEKLSPPLSPPLDSKNNPPPPSKPKAASKPKPTEHARFVEWWDAYPAGAHNDRGTAAKAFTAAVKGGADPDALIGSARAYATKCRGSDPKFTKAPNNWLREKWWTRDDLKPEPPDATRADELEIFYGQYLRNGRIWEKWFGPIEDLTDEIRERVERRHDREEIEARGQQSLTL